MNCQSVEESFQISNDKKRRVQYSKKYYADIQDLHCMKDRSE